MKKTLLIAIILLILAALCAIYFLIPNKIRIVRSTTIDANRHALFRKLSEPESWREWWPGKYNSADNFSLNGIAFRRETTRVLTFPIAFSASTLESLADLTITTGPTGATTLFLETVYSTGYNPIKRISAFFNKKKISRSFSEILKAINSTYSNVANLYGFKIQESRVIDSTLIFNSASVKGIPDIKSIYSLIDELKVYINKNAANETGYPMLNIHTEDSINYVIKVAIPVDKPLPTSGNITYKWMLGGGNILITEVKGGYHEIEKAHRQVMQYLIDYQRSTPAIPFESLVTDRRHEPDTNKWITRIYYPVI